ncbi:MULTISPECIES: ABC transporter ATP-binding protein [unclassified Haloarcula]|uniref:ABC transporter ATP-binding protein n=1 Tax=unclassified Haloarcula TaxID=2624677 RepID=UPI0009AC09AE|nr:MULTISPECIES: ABC transporter ATP-binding protein [unclassified Haloarcula]
MSRIEIRDLQYRYRGSQEWTLSEVSLDIHDCEFVLLLGPSGSGKSTLARCFNGLIPHSVPGELEGGIEVCGRKVTETSQAELAKRVGLVFQNPSLQFVTSTVETEIAFGLENICVQPPEISERIDDALDAVGLSGFESRRIDTLSGGEKQRLAIACQLAMEPEILVLDEPTANLDPQGTEAVYELLEELARNESRTIVLIEHRYGSLINAVDRTLVLDGDGRILLDGAPETVFAENPRQLLDEGVRIPAVTRLALELRSEGVWPDSTSLPVTADQAAETIAEVLTEQRYGRTRCDPQSTNNGAEPDGNVAGSDIAKLPANEAEEPEASDAAPASPALEICGLDARYRTDEASKPVLKDIDLSVPDGSFLGLVGPNGAGKSTLAKHCVGVRSPPPETVFLDGCDVTTLPSREISQHVGYVFQNPEYQFVTDSVREELAYGLRQLDFDADEIERRVEDALEQFDLTGYAEKNPFTLSHGEKRRLSVATMLVVGQDILIIDEPTYGQDRGNTDALMKTLAELHGSGRTVIVLTHDMRIVAEHADTVAVLVDGEICFTGSPSALFKDSETVAAAHLSRPPLAELADRIPGFQGSKTLECCYEYCTGKHTEVLASDQQGSGLDQGEGR